MKKHKIAEAQLGDTATLREAKDFLRENWENGAICPCCTQIVKKYHHIMGSTMAYVLILLVRYFEKHPEAEYVHITNYLNTLELPGAVRNTGDSAKLQHWGLIEKKPGKRDDGSPRAGYWKVTEKGRQFAKGEITVPSYANLFNQKCYGLDGEEITIHEALKNKFNYDELMRA